MFEVTNEILGSVHVSAWAKLYRMEIINQYSLRFPEGKNHEDFYWHWCYFSVTKKVTLIKNRTVRYFRHPVSIMSKTFEQKESKAIDHLLIMDDVCLFFKNNDLWDSKQMILPKLFESCYWFSKQHSPAFQSAQIFGTLIALLRKWEIDCKDYWFLQDAKTGNYDIVVGDVALENSKRGKPNFKAYVKYKMNKLFHKF